MFFTIILFFAVLSLLVFVHELGHFLTARFFKVSCEEFGMGLPPRLVGLQKNNGKWRLVWGNRETQAGEPMIYSLNWIPIGGFVKISGENGENADVSGNFGNKPVWQRNLILSAGVIMNVLLCVFLLFIGFVVGLPSSPNADSRGIIISDQQVQIIEVLPKSLADQAGLLEGDMILELNGTKIVDADNLINQLKTTSGELSLIISRQEKSSLIKIVKADAESDLGVAIVDSAIVRYPWYWAIVKAIETTWAWLVMIFSALFGLIAQFFGGPKLAVDFSGPVGIAVLTGQAVKLGWYYVLQFTAILSLNLAIINILPFPALDGGRIIFLIIGKLRGKMIDSKWENISHNIGFILLMTLVVFVTYRDLLKYGGRILLALGRLVGLN